MIQPTFARKRIDITWSTLFIFIWRYFTRSTISELTQTEIEHLWSPDQTLVTFTVRTDFDLCLQAYAFPAGSEIVVSAVTIPDMIRIVEHHNFVAVPVDIQDDGSVSAVDMEALVTAETKAVLVAHLFGSHMEFDDIAIAAKQRGLVVFEDCAEAFCGRHFTGCQKADVSMFSFGLIKTGTALGGGIFTIRDASVLSNVRSIQAQYPRQATTTYLIRVVKYSVFKMLTDSPFAYGMFLAILDFWKVNHRAFIRRLSRSFAPKTLMLQIRQQPSPLLLQLMSYRLSTFQVNHLQARQERVAYLSTLRPVEFRPVGYGRKHHTYWLCAVQTSAPDSLSKRFYRLGFDAADGGTSLAVGLSKDYPVPVNAERIMKSVIYMPMDHAYSAKQLKQLALLVHSYPKADSMN